MSHISHYSYHNAGDCGRLLNSTVYSCRVNEKISQKEKGYISFDDRNGRIDRNNDDGN